MTYEGAYIRPCAAFPDGLQLGPWVADRLLDRDLIVPAASDVENRHQLDYEAVYDSWNDADIERAVIEIQDVLREYPA